MSEQAERNQTCYPIHQTHVFGSINCAQMAISPPLAVKNQKVIEIKIRSSTRRLHIANANSID